MGELALHQTARQAKPVLAKPSGNAGLWWNKFCHTWRSDFEGLEEPDGGQDGGKLSWIKTLAGSKVGDETLLREHAARRERLVRGTAGGWTDTLVLQGRLVVGTGLSHPVEVGMLFHPTFGVPYLPGASVKGLTRAWARDVLKHEKAPRVFGPVGDDHGVGSVIFLDAVPAAPVRLVAEVMTPHYGAWYQADPARIEDCPPADWYDPTPISFLAVEENQRFVFAVMPNPHGTVPAEQAKQDVTMASEWLADALAWLGAGAKTAVGFGRFASGPLPSKPEAPSGPHATSGETGRAPPAGGRLEIGRRVADLAGSQGVLLGYEGNRALVDFGDGPEAVPPEQLSPMD